MKRKLTKAQNEQLAMIHAGTVAIKEFTKQATTADANNPTITAMAMATLNAIRQTKDANDQALLIGHLALACYVYGRKSGVGDEEE